MKPYTSLLPTVLFALALGATPVEAQGGHGGGGGFHGGGGSFHGGGFHGSGGGGFHGGAEGHNHGGFSGNRRSGQFHDGHFRHDFGHGFRFRPRFGVGFGVFLGYPFDYPFYSPWDYWDYPVGPLAFPPGQGYGGVSFSISPGDASVAVDGIVAGSVDQFNDPESPLNLPPGQHHIQVQAPGYRTLEFDVNVEAGRVVPYAGDLQRQ
jgi:hypothetical protein